MAAPTPASRASRVPAVFPMDDGFSTLVSFAADETFSLWEKTVTPPGMDGGDPIEITTMHNTAWRTFAPRSLMTLTPVTFVGAYDSTAYNDFLNNLVNVKTTVTVFFSDGATLAFYGFLQNFDPQEVSEGNQPEANVTVTPTNWDPTNNVEAAPVITPVTGT